jgi:hypothetical protein
MKKVAIALAVAACSPSGRAMAQEHFTEGPVWEISYYRIKEGKFDAYLKFIRSHFLATWAETKKQGIYLDYKVFLNTERQSEKDWDIAFAFLYPTYARALDYSASDEEKSKAIMAKQHKTKDEDKQREILAPRFEWRERVATRYVREVMLKPPQ